MTRLYIFADDSMQGRETGTPGNVRATTYIAGEFKKIGLRPAGDGGTYFQTIPLVVSTLQPSAYLRVAGAALSLKRGFLPVASQSVRGHALPVIYGGNVTGTSSPSSRRAIRSCAISTSCWGRTTITSG